MVVDPTFAGITHVQKVTIKHLPIEWEDGANQALQRFH